MALNLSTTRIYHITDIRNLSKILKSGGLYSDSILEEKKASPTEIAHSHIKERRLKEIRVSCAGDKFVGEFVPFYFCPRSPMLFTINNGNTNRSAGCQKDIIHLYSNVEIGIASAKDWAYSSGNAGSYIADFYNDTTLQELDWDIIKSNDWGGNFRRDKKAAEFLVHEFFPWESILGIGCHNITTKTRVDRLINTSAHKPVVEMHRDWYY